MARVGHEHTAQEDGVGNCVSIHETILGGSSDTFRSEVEVKDNGAGATSQRGCLRGVRCGRFTWVCSSRAAERRGSLKLQQPGRPGANATTDGGTT